ncbi:MAG: response regulator transcription factor [Solirubrobacterales bacterium]|nr:response regulator transcription factor [Solirubrobacterales bacterium]
MTDQEDDPRLPERTLRILVADDDPLVRSALRAVAAENWDIHIEAEAVDGYEAVALAISHRPDIVLLDVAIPRLDSKTVTRRIQTAVPDVRVMVFSSAEDVELGVAGLRSGAAGFLPKDVSSVALVRALRGLSRGEAVVSRLMTAEIVEQLRRAPATSTGLRPVWSTLTSREWQVVDLLCEGAATAEIADRLCLSVETVRTHLKHALNKLGAHTRDEAIAKAQRLRSGEPPEPVDEPADSLDEPVDEVARRRIAQHRRRRHGDD